MLKKSLLLIAFVLILDQLLKVLIKTNMMIGQEIHFFDWFIIHFTENKGMAFGLEFGGKLGKYLLSIFRILAIVVISVFWLKFCALSDGVFQNIDFCQKSGHFDHFWA